MQHDLKPGLHLSKKYSIEDKDTVINLKTGDVHQAATPSLIILLEKVIYEMISERISDQFTTISAEINMKHLLPLCVGENVTCSVHLKFAEDNKLFFDFAVFNFDEDIAAIGAHERILIKKEEI